MEKSISDIDIINEEDPYEFNYSKKSQIKQERQLSDDEEPEEGEIVEKDKKEMKLAQRISEIKLNKD